MLSPSILCPSEGQGLSEWAEGGVPERGVWGGHCAPGTQSLVERGKALTPWPVSSPPAGTWSHASILTLAFPAVYQGRLPVSWALHAPGSAGRRGSREAALPWRKSCCLHCELPFCQETLAPPLPIAAGVLWLSGNDTAAHRHGEQGWGPIHSHSHLPLLAFCF